jgi:hypothetical protein
MAIGMPSDTNRKIPRCMGGFVVLFGLWFEIGNGIFQTGKSGM